MRSTTKTTAKSTRSTRLGTVAFVAAAATLTLAGPAFAHVEVSAPDARALATDVTLTFDAESESSTVGISELRVILPPGIAPGDVAYASGPEGWKLTATEDGYTVAGPALPAGGDAEHKVTVRRLPDAPELVFKVLQTYRNGRVDRWIDLGTPKPGSGHGYAAPVLKLQAAAPGATTGTQTTTPPAPSAAAGTTPPATPPAASAPAPAPTPSTGTTAAAKDDDDSSAVPITIGVVAALTAIAAGLWWWRRRSSTG